MNFRLDEIVIDCRQPGRVVRFWSALLGGEPVDRHDTWSFVDPPGFPRLACQGVPEAKTVKNRLHLDIGVAPEEIADAIALATAHGATRVGGVVTDPEGSYQIMTDPEGNEFCFVHD